MIPFSTDLDEVIGCPRRDACAWYSPDIAWSRATANGDVKVLKARFRTQPYFKCPDYTMVIPDAGTSPKPHGAA